MWREYSKSYMKNNRSSSFSIRMAAFISAFLLSLLCMLFYNMWKYETERIVLEEGGWHSRLYAELDGEAIEFIKNYASIKDVTVKTETAAGENIQTADLYFEQMRDVLKDTPKIAKSLGIASENVSYHYGLLALYLIRSPQDTAPRMVFPLFILITCLAAFSLIVIIHNAFAVSMNARIRQFGIFASVGAAPRQIRSCLLQEAAGLCVLPVAAGNICGTFSAMGLIQWSNLLLEGKIEGRHPAVFSCHPAAAALTLGITALTICISAWIPARKISRMTPLEAMKTAGGFRLKHKKRQRLLALLFGPEGELAGNALCAQKRALRMSSLSLILSFMAFTLMLCFFTLSQISTRETYFERYKDVWDIMVTAKDTPIEAFDKAEEIRNISDVRNVIVYQKEAARTLITDDEMSEEMKALGGFRHAEESSVKRTEHGTYVNAPVIILDDESFLQYCDWIGIAPQLDGVIVRNKICDVTNPDFRHPRFMPYIKATGDERLLLPDGSKDRQISVPVLAYAQEEPALREEYASLDPYELVHFLPASLWEKLAGQKTESQNDTYICVLAKEKASLEDLDNTQEAIVSLLQGAYRVTGENRIRESQTNEVQIRGMMTVLGSFCALLALIGISNIFSNTLGFVRQRKREIARYMSVGMTQKELRKMFCIEGLVIALRPILITVPVAVIAVGAMLRASYLEAELFLAEAPFAPIALFVAAILGSVSLAYYLGWRGVKKIDLAEVLRDDTMI